MQDREREKLCALLATLDPKEDRLILARLDGSRAKLAEWSPPEQPFPDDDDLDILCSQKGNGVYVVERWVGNDRKKQAKLTYAAAPKEDTINQGFSHLINALGNTVDRLAQQQDHLLGKVGSIMESNAMQAQAAARMLEEAAASERKRFEIALQDAEERAEERAMLMQRVANAENKIDEQKQALDKPRDDSSLFTMVIRPAMNYAMQNPTKIEKLAEKVSTTVAKVYARATGDDEMLELLNYTDVEPL